MAGKITVKFNQSLAKKLEEARIRNALREALTETMIELRDRLSMSPTPKKTGNLRRSNTYEVRLSGDVFEGLVKNSAPYWKYVNFGTSKQDAVHFVDQAVNKVQPNKKIAEKFHQKYKT